MRTEAPQVVVQAVDIGVRPVRLRLPFRFGSVTLQACPQAFVRVQLRAGQRHAQGFAAEMMVPKWFDKRPDRSHADNLGDLAGALERAAGAYVDDDPASAFGLFERHYPALMAAGAAAGATELSAAYGQALLDRAVLDALCAAAGVSFFDAARGNLCGLTDTPLLPDLQGHDWDGWLSALQPLQTVAARHTVGMLDALQHADDDTQPLPTSLQAVIARYGHRHFKIKLGGDPGADAERLERVLDLLDTHAPGHQYTLDGNEQYADAEALQPLFDAVRGLPAWQRRPQALLYIEQPIARDRSLSRPLPWQQSPAPLLMDEADGTLGSWPRGVGLGWHGVSSKSCKGLYKAIANRARCDVLNATARRDGQPPRAFMSAEDLTCQAGLSVQQDLALAALLGLAHSERNGHHYAGGFGTAPPGEQRAFASAHPDLYRGDPAHLLINAGHIDIRSLHAPGFAHGADPDMATLRPLADAAAML